MTGLTRFGSQLRLYRPLTAFSACLLNTSKGGGNKTNAWVAKNLKCLHFCLLQNADSADTRQLAPSSAEVFQGANGVASHWFTYSQVQTKH